MPNITFINYFFVLQVCIFLTCEKVASKCVPHTLDVLIENMTD